MNSILNIFNQNGNTSSTNHIPTSSYPTGSSSLLSCFEAPPLDKPSYGVYELNAMFEYGYSSDFDQNLITVSTFCNLSVSTDSTKPDWVVHLAET